MHSFREQAQRKHFSRNRWRHPTCLGVRTAAIPSIPAPRSSFHACACAKKVFPPKRQLIKAPHAGAPPVAVAPPRIEDCWVRPAHRNGRVQVDAGSGDKSNGAPDIACKHPGNASRRQQSMTSLANRDRVATVSWICGSARNTQGARKWNATARCQCDDRSWQWSHRLR